MNDLQEKLEEKVEQHNEIAVRQQKLREEYADLEAERQALAGGIATLSEIISQSKEAPKEDEAEE